MDPTNALPPQPRSGHRRHYSETLFRLPSFTDDLLNLSDIDLSDDHNNSLSPGPTSSSNSGTHNQVQTHGRSMSVDAAFFEEFMGDDRKQQKLHKSGPTSPEVESEYAKKAMAADKIAELALLDPKRAKRILANRQSAAKSKERKIRYTNELERKVQTLQTEATTLSAQLTLLQRDTTGLTSENRELKLRLQAMEQQAHLHNALNDALREEVQRLKIATGQIPDINGNIYNRAPFFTNPHNVLPAQPQTPSSGQSHSNHSQNGNMDYM